MVVWFVTILSGEIGVFMFTSCSWPMEGRGLAERGGTTRIVVMADMQLSDFGSYAFAPEGSALLKLIMTINDAFLR
jgi:hypothetical protein